MIIKLPLANATDEQIRDFAETMQIDTSTARDRAGLIAMLGLAWEHDYIRVLVEADDDDGGEAAGEPAITQTETIDATAQRMTGGIGENDPKVRIRITKTEQVGGKDPVPVGHNGRTVVIQRDKDVDIPYRFYCALKDAIREDVTQDPSTGDITTDAVTAYPVSVLAMPSPEQIAAWEARTAKDFAPA